MNKQTDKKEITKDAEVLEGRDKTLNIFQRMNLVQNSVDYIQKNKPSGMKYSIVSHDDVTAKTRPHLVRAGVLYYPINIRYSQVGNRTEVELDLIFQNIDNKEDKMSVSCLGFGCDPGDKGPGKAVSYAVKYGLLKGLGLETGDDADLEEVQHQNTSQNQGDPRPNDREPITPKQVEVLKGLIAETNSNEQLFLKAVFAESLESIPAFNYEMAYQKLIAKKKGMNNATGK